MDELLTVEELEKNPSARDFLRRLDVVKRGDSKAPHTDILGSNVERPGIQLDQK